MTELSGTGTHISVFHWFSFFSIKEILTKEMLCSHMFTTLGYFITEQKTLTFVGQMSKKPVNLSKTG